MEKEIAKKLLEVQANLNAPKNMRNTFGNYSYRSAESILLALKPLEKQFKVVVTVNDEIIPIGDKTYIKATATITDCETGQSVSTSAYARESYNKKGMDDAQMTGATSSYARKYALNGLLAIDDNKDPDTNEFRYVSDNAAKAEQQNAPISNENAEKVIASLKSAKNITEFNNVWKALSAEMQKNSTVSAFAKEKCNELRANK